MLARCGFAACLLAVGFAQYGSYQEVVLPQDPTYQPPVLVTLPPTLPPAHDAVNYGYNKPTAAPPALDAVYGAYPTQKVFSDPVAAPLPTTQKPKELPQTYGGYGTAVEVKAMDEKKVETAGAYQQVTMKALDANQNAYGAYGSQPALSPSFSCVGKPDGYYVEGCSNAYWSCSGNVAVHHTCHEGTWFSVETQRCDSREFVVECGGQVPPPTTEAPARDNSVANGLCRNKEDGLYSIGNCINEFLHCSGGVGSISPCQTGLVFDGKTGQCEQTHICAMPAQDPVSAYGAYETKTPAPALDLPTQATYGSYAGRIEMTPRPIMHDQVFNAYTSASTPALPRDVANRANY